VILISEEQMVEISTLIIRGRVVSQRSILGPNRMGIVTLVTIEVAEEVVGRSAPRQIIVRHFGGQIGDQKIEMMGGPSFVNNTEVLIFVQSSPYLPDNEYLLIGLNQGKWLIHRPAPQTSHNQSVLPEPIITRSLRGMHLIQMKKESEGTLTPNYTTLNNYVKRLRQHWVGIQQRKQQNQLQLPKLSLPKATLPQILSPRKIEITPKDVSVRPKITQEPPKPTTVDKK
jgi:hypothetical protein